MKGEFIARTRELQDQIGDGKITASVVVDQVYAEFQHERTDLKHRSGKANYLRDPLFAGVLGWFRKIGAEMTMRNMQHIFVDIADDLSGGVADEAPVFLGDLRSSGQPRVKDRGRWIYRGTHAPRLSKRVAEAKSALWHDLYGNRRGRGR